MYIILAFKTLCLLFGTMEFLHRRIIHRDTARDMFGGWCVWLRIDRAPAETTPRDTNSRILCRHP